MASDDDSGNGVMRRRGESYHDGEERHRERRRKHREDAYHEDDGGRQRRRERSPDRRGPARSRSPASGRGRIEEGGRERRDERRMRSPQHRKRRRSVSRGEDRTRDSAKREHRDQGAAHGEDRHSGRRVGRSGGPLPSQADSFAVTKGEEPEKPKEKPNLSTTGHLAAASNSVTQADGTSITLKYHEPPEARKPPPKDEWKLYVFKGPDVVDTVELSNRSCWLVGREAAVVDLLAEHPSISKQHAAVQFRYTEKRNEFGDKIGRVKPYLIDLESANGTMLNKEKVPDRRFLELRDKDLIQFGLSTREYVLMLAPRH